MDRTTQAVLDATDRDEKPRRLVIPDHIRAQALQILRKRRREREQQGNPA